MDNGYSVEEILKAIDDLQKITPEELEYLTSIALICVCDKDSMIIPNLDLLFLLIIDW